MIIGISGKKGHGKDLLAMIIQFLIANQDKVNLEDWVNGYTQEQREFQSGWVKKMFAGKVKEIVSLMIGCSMEDLEDQHFKEKPLGPEWSVWMPFSFRLDNFIGSMYHTKEECVTAIKHYHTIGVEDSVTPQVRQMTPRLMLQLMGTECGRRIIHPNAWVNALFTEYEPFNEVKEVVFESAGKQEDKWKVPEWPSIPSRYWGIEVPYPVIAFTDYDKDEYPDWLITDVRFSNEVKAIKDREGLIFRISRPGMDDSSTHESETGLDYLKPNEYDAYIENNGDIETLTQKVRTFLIYHKIIPNG